MRKLLYKNYVETLSKTFEANLVSIEASYGFDYGTEFEVVLCETLRQALPQKFGICRGYVVDADGNDAGDDLVIYAQDRFPTLRLRRPDYYSRKEYIPIEAALAYVEAKHTLYIEPGAGASLHHACQQVAAVKKVCSRRKSVPLLAVDPYINLKLPILNNVAVHSIRNPMYGAVVARQVAMRKGTSPISDPQEIAELLKRIIPTLDVDKEYFPDLIIAGKSNIVVPGVKKNIGGIYFNPFFWPDGCSSCVQVVSEMAFGVGLCCLSFALDWIRLGKLRIPEIIGDALGLDIFEEDPNLAP